MSTESTAEKGTQRTEHKVLNLYGEQIDAYQHARVFALAACGGDATEGDLIEEIATTYVESLHDPDADCEPHTIGDMVAETAAETGDPTFSFRELTRIDGHVLDRLVTEATTDEITALSTNMEILAYFCCPP